MASRQTYIGYAEAAAQVLSEKWFGEDGLNKWVNDPGYPDYWRAPNLVIALTDLMQLTGSRSYWSTVADARKYFHEYFCPPNGRLPAFYDDECWWGSCFLRLGALTGDNAWISAADPIFTDLKGGWDDCAFGGVWWRRDPKSFPDNEKGAIENQLYMDIAMGLYAANPKQTYLDATNQTWQWMQRLIDPTGLVWGSLEKDGTIMRSNVPRPYIQGVVLAPLWAMYKLAGDTTYLDRAEQIAQAAIDKMTWPDGILREACEERGNCGPNDIDSTLFKGIFVRYLGEFAHRLAAIDDPARKKTAQRYAAFLQHNADAVWANFPGGIFGIDWRTPQPKYQPDNSVAWSYQYNGTLQCSALDLFVAAALVSQ
jgi:predicted alpha-1,6-mannanase (GH76 family)